MQRHVANAGRDGDCSLRWRVQCEGRALISRNPHKPRQVVRVGNADKWRDACVVLLAGQEKLRQMFTLPWGDNSTAAVPDATAGRQPDNNQSAIRARKPKSDQWSQF